MTPFLKANFPIWDLPMKERFTTQKSIKDGDTSILVGLTN